MACALSWGTAQVGLGVPLARVAADFEISGEVKQVNEVQYTSEGETVTRAQLLAFDPWIRHNLSFVQGQLTRSEFWGGRTDGIANHGVTTFAFRGPCLVGRSQLDLSVYPCGREPSDGPRRETFEVNSKCQPLEIIETVYGKPSLRKAYIWNSDGFSVTAYRRDNSVAYLFTRNCAEASVQCSDTTEYGLRTDTRAVKRSSTGKLMQIDEISVYNGIKQQHSIHKYNARGWLSSSAFLNQQTRKTEPGRIYKYPKVDAQNWLEQEVYTVEYEFGKSVLNLTSLTKRTLTYTKS